MLNIVKGINQLLESCLPSCCLLCHLPSKKSLICDYCLQDILTERSYCLHCGHELTETRPYCGSCLKHPFKFSHLHALGSYQPPFPQLIKQLKYNNQLLNADLLGQLLAQSVQQRYSKQELNSIDYFIPVPLHNKKLRKRGFNQSQLLLDAVLKKLDLVTPIMTLDRDKETNAQEGLSRSQRKRNLQGAFSLKYPTQLRDKSVVVIDDVVTTGATINALCQCLIKAKVKRIVVWCICRTELK